MIGGALVRRLLAEDVEVRALVRAESDTSGFAPLPVEVLVGDLASAEDAARAVERVDWVFHLAGALTVGSAFGHSPGGYDLYRRANVDTTGTLLAASARAGVARFVYASSVAVYDLETSSPISEDAPLRPASDYGRSKLRAEELVREYARELDATIVRPCVVYGEHDRYLVPLVLALARLPVLPVVRGGRHVLDLVHADDVAELLWAASRSPAAARGRAYNAASGAPVPLRRVVDAVAAALGRRARVLSVSPAVLRASAPLGRLYLRAFAPEAGFLLGPVGIGLMGRDVSFDVSRARAELGYSPQADVAERLTAAVRSAERRR
jgi:nucleoside-diphosphate-sugar epimerase